LLIEYCDFGFASCEKRQEPRFIGYDVLVLNAQVRRIDDHPDRPTAAGADLDIDPNADRLNTRLSRWAQVIAAWRSAGQALTQIGRLYEIEAETKALAATERQTIRQARAGPIIDELYNWLIAQRQRLPKGSATSKAIHYSLKRWPALKRCLEDGAVPIDNNWVENQVRPWALDGKTCCLLAHCAAANVGLPS